MGLNKNNRLPNQQQQWGIRMGDMEHQLTEILGACPPEPSSNGYPSALEEDSYFTGTGPTILYDRSNSLRKVADGVLVGDRESNVLFVDALPSDSTRREVSHLFRPFPGFQEIRLVHKEPIHSEDKSVVLCFVEFSDSSRALTALEALEGYKFDNTKPDSPDLRIHFAHFPFQLPPINAHIPSQLSPDNSHFPSQLPRRDACFLSQPLLDSVIYPSKLPHDSAHFPCEQTPNSPQFSSQLRFDSVVSSSKLPPESTHFPSKLPPNSAHFSSQLLSNSAHLSSQLPPNSAHLSSQLPPNIAHSPFQLLPHREEQDLAISREKELVVQDEELVMMTKNSKGCYTCGKPGYICMECKSQPQLCYGF
ncbi:hypothetical protein M8C21_002929 [Ambrosia artemisiifolia]|uniref:RRM domain-containing protein n=1 Tax=Ambrosia artemisiifolia TaxID=4212 RepID=A0AAD5BTY4_AMBAR|nr:hypothetical protein M8C21_002929 [Ambrosia artemisiifolia]